MSADKQTRRNNKKNRSDFSRLSNRFMSGLLRSLFLVNQTTHRTQSGFVLPTTVLLLLMVTLTAGAISFRSFSRTQSVIAQREQEVIVGAATPAVDRAKAKIEYLFSQDIRFPGGLPTSNKLQAMMGNVENLESGGSNNAPFPGTDENSPPYTLPDEFRLDINNDGVLDNAWYFYSDIDGDGEINDGDGTIPGTELIVYSVLMDDAQLVPGGDPTDPDDVRAVDDAVNQDKANALVTRNAPIDTATSGNSCPVIEKEKDKTAKRGTNSRGWEELDNVNLLKNFQIDVFVVNDNPINKTVSTLEFQQVRQAERGNKWGAWFRNDLEIFPGPNFNWNGAMHTEGSVFLGNEPRLNLISAYASCLYPDPSASEITLTSSGDSFRGQLVAGKLNSDRDGKNGYEDKNKPSVDWSNGVGNNHGELKLNRSNDSVDEGSKSSVSDVALDPIQIFTADVSIHRNSDNWKRWKDWNKSSLTSNEGDSNARVIDEPNSNVPFLDDMYRADNRYGPKPSYNTKLRLDEADDGKGVSIGTIIPDKQSVLVEPDNGLDGYWERQAIKEGLRIIGGQRLELGNSTIWKGSGTSDDNFMDPLYPYNKASSKYGSSAPNPLKNNSDQSMRQHRLSLRDNLAAVQSMAVYHASGKDGGNFPLMCMSMTSHPGTYATIERSTSFDNVTIGSGSISADGSVVTGGKTAPDIDFFNGFGTNGWEYDPPLANESAFASAYNTSNSVLKKSLKNLAMFAGDPLGGAPSFTPVQDNHVHPYPTMSMWGDFSHLRRLVDPKAVDPENPEPLAGIDYADLSPADQTYLHTAACTLGMLADNITTINSFKFTIPELDELSEAIGELVIPDVSDPFDIGHPSYSNEFSLPTSSHAYVSMLQTKADRTGATLKDKRIARNARIFHLKYQIARDRKYGFANAKTLTSSLLPTGVPFPIPVTTEKYEVEYGPHDLSGRVEGNFPTAQEIPEKTALENSVVLIGKKDVTDNFSVDGTYFGLGEKPNTKAKELKFLRLAALANGIDIPDKTAISNPIAKNSGNPQFPSLFYLFPSDNHDHNGAGTSTSVILQPIDEPYIKDDALYISIKNTGFEYKAISDTDLSLIALAPKASGAWISPFEVYKSGSSSNKIIVAGTDQSILFLDKGYMNGRELLNSRVIDIDINLATKKTVTSTSTDHWIAPNSPTTTGGIVYAFREDARREDSIVRPIRDSFKSKPKELWKICAAKITKSDCLMQLDAGNAFDPPLRRTDGTDDSYISPKPVDYFADPARRPHGFRLSNGATLNRDSDITAGLSFVSDNLIMVKGDFNIHVSGSGDDREEFDETLVVDGKGKVKDDDFYEKRKKRSEKFANPSADNDTWRPVELVGDAVIIVSDNFNDGAISDSFTTPRLSSDYSGTSSYQNHLRLKGNEPKKDKTLPGSIRTPSLFRENPYDGHTLTVSTRLDADITAIKTLKGDGIAISLDKRGDAPSSPVKVWRDGNLRGEKASLTGDLMTLADSNMRNWRTKDLILARTTTVNALMVAGVIPSRGGQSNGGLHNHPRFLEHWDSNGVFMKIAGGFFQLNYSTSATGPFDQKANVWEPTTDAPSGDESIPYYGAPRRVWGYDVALQFVPAGPVANRFITISAPRSEYYQEVAADDPYMRNLQCAVDSTGGAVITPENRTVACQQP